MANGTARLSIPGAGRTVASSAEERAVFVREAVDIVEEALAGREVEADFDTVFGPRWQPGDLAAEHEPISRRAAWALVNVWLTAALSASLSGHGDICEAEDWFFGEDKAHLPSLAGSLSAQTRFLLSRPLGKLKVNADLLDLLPYVLEPHGPGSRLTVMRDPSTLAAWDAKRERGVFYTPSDVAEYMAAAVLDDLPPRDEPSLVLDPSCGTGVFLVAMLGRAAGVDPLAYAVGHLYGVDISDRSVDSCAFVLLNHCLASVSARRISAWSAWHALRLNLAVADSLKLKVEKDTDWAPGQRCREELRATFLNQGWDYGKLSKHRAEAVPSQPGLFGWHGLKEGLIDLGRLFPEMARGCDLLVGNPPYTELGSRDDRKLLAYEYAALKHAGSGGTENTYLMFVEMMWRLTRLGHNAAGLVLPLSIAYHQGGEYRGCRQAMSAKGGHWRCAFFDREPHALFGEDVKTRNAILFRRETAQDPGRGSKAIVETGPLRKWTSRTRETLFDSIQFTRLANSNIARGIPKLEGEDASAAFAALMARKDSLKTLYRRARNVRQSDAFAPGAAPRVFLASTAYNFLNVYRDIRDEGGDCPPSENSVHGLDFASEGAAEVVFAVLSSRLVYWLWHALGDGFHVARWFIESIPFGASSFTASQSENLQHFGRELWAELQRHRIVSVNRGKRTIAFRPLACDRERDAIDAVLLDVANLPQVMGDLLRSFVVSTVIVDHTDARRQHLASHFQRVETRPCPTELP